jgi:limonene-1,2-epoxide hydrolase
VVRRLALLAVLALAACGGGPRGPESVVRAWSSALNDGDDVKAAALVAPGARVIQNDGELLLHGRADALAWTRGLPCSGRITELEVKGEVVTATFALGERPGHTCDAPGVKAETVFRVHEGRIALWHQIASEGTPPPIA